MSRFLMHGFPESEAAFAEVAEKCPSLAAKRTSAIKTARGLAILVIIFGMTVYFTRLIVFGACMLLSLLATGLAYAAICADNRALYDAYLSLQQQQD